MNTGKSFSVDIDNAMYLWTIYDHPRDYPKHFVARRWLRARGVAHATEDVLLADDLATLRIKMMEHGHFWRLDRTDHDDPVIVEIWL